MQKISTFLWFDNNAEEAVNFYTSIFRNSSVKDKMYSSVDIYVPAGTLLTVAFELEGHGYIAMNGGPGPKFNDSISLSVACTSQEEIDYYWSALLAGGGKPSQCGWLKDRFGLSWQVTPTRLIELMRDEDRAKAGRVMAAMMKMTKIDLSQIEAAYAGE